MNHSIALIVALLLVLTACAGTEERRYRIEDAYNIAADEFTVLVSNCDDKRGIIVIPNKHSTRTNRGYTLEDFRTAVCRRK